MVSSMGQFDRQGHVCRKDVRQKSSTAGGYYAMSVSCSKTRSFPVGSILLGKACP